MTNKEAIEWVENRMGIGRYHPSVHNPFVYDECCKAGDMAIDAIKKQIPQKPSEADVEILYDTSSTTVTYYHCSKCDYNLESRQWGWCPICGQKIDWRENNV